LKKIEAYSSLGRHFSRFSCSLLIFFFLKTSRAYFPADTACEIGVLELSQRHPFSFLKLNRRRKKRSSFGEEREDNFAGSGKSQKAKEKKKS